jgi:uncharacterized membrane protein
LWSVAQGHVNCSTIPAAVRQIMHPTRLAHLPGLIKNEWVLDAAAFAGSAVQIPGNATACAYYPGPYVAPAVTARLLGLDLDGRPYRGSMMRAIYGARLTNWLLMTLAVLWLLVAAPWARSFTLFFYGVPEVIQQSIAVSTDSFLFALTLAIGGLWLARASWSRMAWLTLWVTLMTMGKPIYALLAPAALPAAAALRAQEGRRTLRQWLLPLVLIVPVAAWELWARVIVHYDNRTDWHPSWGVDPTRQLAFLKEHPAHLLTLAGHQIWNTLRHGRGRLMYGSWTSILGGFGWSAFEMELGAYYLLLVALVAALAADFLAAARPPELGPVAPPPRLERAAWWGALGAIFAIIPASVLAMYLNYSTVGAGEVNGIQGRYYLTPLFLLALAGLYRAQRRWPPPPLAARADRWRHLPRAAELVAAFGCLTSHVFALVAIRYFFYDP